MGYMNNLSIARDEWLKQVMTDLGEPLTIVTTPEPEWFMARTNDGIIVSLIDDLEYVELDPETALAKKVFGTAPIECDAKNPEERADAIRNLRNLIKNS